MMDIIPISAYNQLPRYMDHAFVTCGKGPEVSAQEFRASRGAEPGTIYHLTRPSGKVSCWCLATQNVATEQLPGNAATAESGDDGYTNPTLE